MKSKILTASIISATMIAQAGIAYAEPLPRPAQFACAACHGTSKGGAPTIGPDLWGLSQRTVGSLAGYAYSPAMKQAGGTWTRERLIKFIINPRGEIAGTKMIFAGQRDPKIAAAIADYILSLK